MIGKLSTQFMNEKDFEDWKRLLFSSPQGSIYSSPGYLGTYVMSRAGLSGFWPCAEAMKWWMASAFAVKASIQQAGVLMPCLFSDFQNCIAGSCYISVKCGVFKPVMRWFPYVECGGKDFFR